MTLTVGSLFSGIGGLDLGLERAGMVVRWQSEIDPYASRVLAKHWPDVPNLGDITAIDWSTVEPVDVICGGYPCQPFSLAGVRRGEADARHLWPHFAHAIGVVRPRFALLENVPGHLSLGFGRVLGDLAELGFDADWECIPAAAVGAPHLRYRVFVVAHTDDTGRIEQRRSGAASTQQSSAQRRGAMADADGPTHWRVDQWPGQMARRRSLHPGRAHGADSGPISLRPWAVEPDVGRVAHGVPARVDRLRTLGNAVVPQVAEWIGRRILATVESPAPPADDDDTNMNPEERWYAIHDGWVDTPGMGQ